MRFNKEGERIAVVLDDGESVMEGLKQVCTSCNINSAIILSGIGMMRDMEIGYWNGSEYEVMKRKEPAELLSLQGSVALLSNQLSPHIHISLAGKDHACFGGHLVGGTVHNVNEIALLSFRGPFIREFSSKTGLNMLKLP